MRRKLVKGSLSQFVITMSLHNNLILWLVGAINYISGLIYKEFGIPQIISVSNCSLLLRNCFFVNLLKSFSVIFWELSRVCATDLRLFVSIQARFEFIDVEGPSSCNYKPERSVTLFAKFI